MAKAKKSKQKRIGRTVVPKGFTSHKGVGAYIKTGKQAVLVSANDGGRNSFKLTGRQMLDRYADSPAFRAICDSGKYAYIDHSLVLRSSECIEVTGGQLKIKSSALKNQSAYFYHRNSRNTLYGHVPMHSKPGVPHAWHMAGHAQRQVRRPGKGTIVVSEHNAELVTSLTTDDWTVIVGNQNNLPGSFSEALRQLMSERNYTEEGLAETSNFSAKTIQRLRNGTSKPKIETVVAICVGLSLDNYTGHRLVNTAGFAFTGTPKDRALEFILGVAFEVDIFQANEFLNRMGFKSLN